MILKNFNYHVTYFLSSAPDIRYLPRDNGIEVAFIGRSNSGKSSVLNALTNQKNLARTSKRPGCTQMINFFEIKSGYRLVDLPGYGYANCSEKIQNKWQNAISEYLKIRHCLKGLVVIMDIRHPLQLIDRNMIQWAVDVKMPILVLLTKDDKLIFSTRKAQLNIVREFMLHSLPTIQVETFSSRTKNGVNKLIEILNTWFNEVSPVIIDQKESSCMHQKKINRTIYE